ncbi:hypothetical protein [Nonomuraea basaltis]|uniref:hypothetical protein n=1 Tax=Nonomuraea basaltis TaxID=2495887 RepID=UPI00110C5080|nr:hypothetical protein [Nonomuraea basaltis]TMR95742.1 hypothetical protein EJK15_26780 [Nonomuraea basaltis]
MPITTALAALSASRSTRHTGTAEHDDEGKGFFSRLDDGDDDFFTRLDDMDDSFAAPQPRYGEDVRHEPAQKRPARHRRAST